MSGPVIKRTAADPTLKDLLDLAKRDIMLSLNCHAIATVKSFNAEKRTVDAIINYTKTILRRHDDGTFHPEELDYPQLLDVPVVVMGGGGSYLTFPISPGDQCVILFNDRDLDNWASGQATGPVNSPRAHSLSDGMALIGFPKISSYDTTRALLANGATQLGAGASKVLLRNGTETLGAILADFITALTSLTTNPVSSGSPATLNPGSISALNAIASRLGNLLE